MTWLQDVLPALIAGGSLFAVAYARGELNISGERSVERLLALRRETAEAGIEAPLLDAELERRLLELEARFELRADPELRRGVRTVVRQRVDEVQTRALGVDDDAPVWRKRLARWTNPTLAVFALAAAVPLLLLDDPFGFGGDFVTFAVLTRILGSALAGLGLGYLGALIVGRWAMIPHERARQLREARSKPPSPESASSEPSTDGIAATSQDASGD